MDTGFKVVINKDFSMKYEIGEKDRYDLKAEFGKLFHQSAEMLKWFDDGNVPESQKLEYFQTMFWIITNLYRMLEIMMGAGITEKEIIEILQVPF